MSETDLMLATDRGLMLLPEPGLGGVRLTGRTLRYDPETPPERRRALVLAALESFSRPQPREIMALLRYA